MEIGATKGAVSSHALLSQKRFYIYIMCGDGYIPKLFTCTFRVGVSQEECGFHVEPRVPISIDAFRGFLVARLGSSIAVEIRNQGAFRLPALKYSCEIQHRRRRASCAHSALEAVMCAGSHRVNLTVGASSRIPKFSHLLESSWKFVSVNSLVIASSLSFAVSTTRRRRFNYIGSPTGLDSLTNFTVYFKRVE